MHKQNKSFSNDIDEKCYIHVKLLNLNILQIKLLMMGILTIRNYNNQVDST